MKRRITPSRNDTIHLRASRVLRIRSLLLLNFGLFLAVSPPTSAQVNLPAEPAARQDRILVKPKAGVDLGPLHAIRGIGLLRKYPHIGNLQVLRLPPGSTVDATIAVYQQSGLVEYAEPDFLVKALAAPNDLHYGSNSLWGLHNIGQFGGTPDGDIDAPEAWDILHDATDVIVAVIDSGIRPTHEDLATNL